MPNVKEGVVFWPSLHERLEADVEAIDRAHLRVGAKRPAFITSARDGRHAEASKHYAGRALDLRSKDLPVPVKTALLKELRRVLGPDYVVLLEDEGQANEHFHIQLGKKGE